MQNTHFRFGDWQVSPACNAIACGALTRQMEPRAMEVLLALCERADAVVSTEELLERCWGSTLHGDNPVHKTITQLRRLLGDSATASVYIQTIRKRGYRAVAEVKFDAAQAAPSDPAWLQASPFCGLQAFGEQHASVFFGRGDATLRLRLALAEQLAAGRALQLLLGPSGSGKSSLVRAGLLPALMRAEGGAPALVGSAVTFDLGDIAAPDVFTALGGALIDWEFDGEGLFPGASATTLGARLAQDPVAVAHALARTLAPDAGVPPQRCLLFVDRLEALFALPGIDEAQRQCFVRALDALSRSRCAIVVAACRNDFYPRLAEFPLLMEGKARGAHFDLLPPSYSELAQIIRLPARAAQLSFGRDPATGRSLDDILGDSAAGSPDALPLLQYTLQELYRQRSAAGELTLDAYRRLGGMEGAIGRRAEDVVGALTETQRACLPHLFSLVVTIDAQENVTSRRASWSALDSEAARATVLALVDARLLVSELVGGAAGFGIAHEAILRRWPRLTDWLATHRDALRARAPIADLSARWQASGQPDDLLLPAGQQLKQALRLLELPGLPLSSAERDLIAASRRKARRRERLRAGAIATIAALALLATVLGLHARAAQSTAQQRRAEAEGLMEFMLGDFAEKLRPLGRLDLLDSISTKALSYLSNAANDDSAAMTRRAKALQQLAEVQIARGAPQTAWRALEAARAILLRQLADAPRERSVLMNLGANSFWMGQIRLGQNDWNAAERYLRQYRDYSDRVHALDPDALDALVEQSYAHNSLGTLALRRGDAHAASAEFLKSIALKRRALAHDHANASLVAELADSISWAASAAEASGRLAQAMALYDSQLETLATLHRRAPGDALWSYRLAAALQNKAALELATGQDVNALTGLDQAARLFADIIRKEPDNRIWKANGIYVDFQRARVAARGAGSAPPLAAWREIAARADAMHQLDSQQLEWARLAALAQRELSLALHRLHDDAQAKQYMNAALSRLEQLLRRNDTDLYTREALADTLLAAAGIEARHGTSARARCGAARDLLGAVAAHSIDFRILDPWVRASLCLGLDTEANDGKARLRQLGYRDADYLQYLETH